MLAIVNFLSWIVSYNSLVHQVVSTKSLGVYVVENLLWNVHINNMAKEIASGIDILKRSRPFVGQH